MILCPRSEVDDREKRRGKRLGAARRAAVQPFAAHGHDPLLLSATFHFLRKVSFF